MNSRRPSGAGVTPFERLAAISTPLNKGVSATAGLNRAPVDDAHTPREIHGPARRGGHPLGRSPYP